MESEPVEFDFVAFAKQFRPAHGLVLIRLAGEVAWETAFVCGVERPELLLAVSAGLSASILALSSTSVCPKARFWRSTSSSRRLRVSISLFDPPEAIFAVPSVLILTVSARGCALAKVDGREVCADVPVTKIKIVPQSAARSRWDLFIMTSDSLSSGSRKQAPRRLVRRSLASYS
jgi:hypothetical protein